MLKKICHNMFFQSSTLSFPARPLPSSSLPSSSLPSTPRIWPLYHMFLDRKLGLDKTSSFLCSDGRVAMAASLSLVEYTKSFFTPFPPPLLSSNPSPPHLPPGRAQAAQFSERVTINQFPGPHFFNGAQTHTHHTHTFFRFMEDTLHVKLK